MYSPNIALNVSLLYFCVCFFVDVEFIHFFYLCCLYLQKCICETLLCTLAGSRSPNIGCSSCLPVSLFQLLLFSSFCMQYKCFQVKASSITSICLEDVVYWVIPWENHLLKPKWRRAGDMVKQCIFPAARNCAGKSHKLIDFWLIEQIGADMKWLPFPHVFNLVHSWWSLAHSWAFATACTFELLFSSSSPVCAEAAACAFVYLCICICEFVCLCINTFIPLRIVAAAVLQQLTYLCSGCSVCICVFVHLYANYLGRFEYSSCCFCAPVAHLSVQRLQRVHLCICVFVFVYLCI